jgi:hypothetical protein
VELQIYRQVGAFAGLVASGIAAAIAHQWASFYL